MSLLIVDDTSDNVFLLKKILQKEGFENILTASSAKEAFQILGLEGHAKKSEDIKLILMDVMMPEISGIEACQRIQACEALKDIPIIMVTARTDMESLQEAFQAGAVDYVTKPVRRVELLSRVRVALRLKLEMDQLKKAMSEIKVLRGFIPICAYCKKIRDLSGLWTQMETYMMQHSEAVFSHGICQDCAQYQYSKFEQQQNSEERKKAS